ncbi:Uncharacterised protein [Serratia quinivorans]|uniref:Uncharacterized protein n=1 Tax=Serratia quinivorans TaxID=137545 RepID=A0A379YTG3_9GAMM|nr:Uncharacterised protein [Serratia quinivorans]SUI50075.1 Uncharacterised protein [Serratia quinivorans]
MESAKRISGLHRKLQNGSLRRASEPKSNQLNICTKVLSDFPVVPLDLKDIFQRFVQALSDAKKVASVLTIKGLFISIVRAIEGSPIHGGNQDRYKEAVECFEQIVIIDEY